MSQFIKVLTQAVSNHIESNNLIAYVNEKVVFNKNKFFQAMIRCTGDTFGYTDIDKFVNSKQYLLALVDNISHNSDRSFDDFVYIITCIANRSYLKPVC